jgi:2'-5' RNA ligase
LERLSFWLHNRIAYATLQAEVPSLSQLVATLRQQVFAAGFGFENHEFTPHVTLLRGVGHALDSQAITPINWWVDSFVLVESFKVEQGSRYQVLQKWSLSA